MNGRWQYFLNSLATVGGNLFLLTIFVVMLLGITMFLLVHKIEGDAVTVVSTTFSGFAGALLAALRGRTTDLNPSPPKSNGNTTTSTTATITTEAHKDQPAPPAK